MRTQCTFCGQRFEIGDNYLGKTVGCTNCGKDFVVSALPERKVLRPVPVKPHPERSDFVPPPPPKPAPPPPKVPAPGMGGDLYSLLERQGLAPKTPPPPPPPFSGMKTYDREEEKPASGLDADRMPEASPDRKSSSPFSFDFGGGKGSGGRFLLPIAAAVFALFVIAVLLMNGGGRGRMLIIDELFRENLISLLNAGSEIETMSSRGIDKDRLEASANRLEAQLKLLQANRAAFPADSGDLEAALAKYGQAVTGWRHAIELWDAKRNSSNASWPGFDLSTAYGEAFYRQLESYAGERIAEALNPDKKYLDFDRAVGILLGVSGDHCRAGQTGLLRCLSAQKL